MDLFHPYLSSWEGLRLRLEFLRLQVPPPSFLQKKSRKVVPAQPIWTENKGADEVEQLPKTHPDYLLFILGDEFTGAIWKQG